MTLIELSVLTLNVWGIPFVSSNRAARIAAIGAQLAQGQYDIVALQEVWSQADCETLIKLTASTLPFDHYFYSGVIGAGLLVLSKYPIISTLFHAWSVNGYFHRFHHGDWFGGKGVGMCRILVGDHIIHVYNAHLHAEYNENNDDYKTHRVIQAFEAAQFVEATRGESVLQLLMGDLNTKPTDICYRLILHTADMRDCCSSEEFVTSDCKGNSYTSGNALSKNPHGIRIDHILMRTATDIKASIVDFSHPLPTRVPDCTYSYSDHEAVQAKFEVDLSREKKNSLPILKTSQAPNFANVMGISDDLTSQQSDRHKPSFVQVLHEAIVLCEKELHKLKTDRVIYCIIAVIVLFLLITMAEYTVPLGLTTCFQSLRFLFFGVAIYCVFMSSIWNFMEINSVRAGKKAMELTLNSAENFNMY